MAQVNVWGTKYNTNNNNKNKGLGASAAPTVGIASQLANTKTNTSAAGAASPIGGFVSQLVNANGSNGLTNNPVDATVSQSGTVASGGTNKNSIYSRSMDLMRKAAQMQMNNQLNTLKNSMHQLLGSYQSSQNALNQQLDADINQNEVERYKAQRALRETLANRGALNSGAGRQEALNMSNAYSNRQSAIQQAYNTNMNDLRNNANAALSNLDLAYNDSLQNTNSNIMQQLADYYAKGYKSNTDYTIKGGDEWNNMVAELRKQYGL